jgi:hypothetical protein
VDSRNPDCLSPKFVLCAGDFTLGRQSLKATWQPGYWGASRSVEDMLGALRSATRVSGPHLEGDSHEGAEREAGATGWKAEPARTRMMAAECSEYWLCGLPAQNPSPESCLPTGVILTGTQIVLEQPPKAIVPALTLLPPNSGPLPAPGHPVLPELLCVEVITCTHKWP